MNNGNLAFAHNWWLFVLRGVLAIIFAVLAFMWPGLALSALVILFGAYSLVDGVFAVAAALQRIGRQDRWWALLIEGLLGIGAGIVTFAWPDITALVLITIIGVWAIFTGVMEVVAAVELRKHIDNEWLLGIGGALSILVGLLMIFFPGAGALSLIWLIASYAFVFGIVLIVLGLRLRDLQHRAGTRAPHAV